MTLIWELLRSILLSLLVLAALSVPEEMTYCTR